MINNQFKYKLLSNLQQQIITNIWFGIFISGKKNLFLIILVFNYF